MNFKDMNESQEFQEGTIKGANTTWGRKLEKEAKKKDYKNDLEKGAEEFMNDKKNFKETMNFTEFKNSAVAPLYEKEGEIPKCPPGYRFDKEMMMCVPKTKKDAVGDSKYGDKDLKPGNGASYNVWGNSGYSGAGFAWEEPPTSNDTAGGEL